MKRVSVIGMPGSGKTTLGMKLAEILSCRFVELDAIYHQPGWQPMEETQFQQVLDDITSAEHWVVDGSYEPWTVEGIVWQRADTVVWVCLDRWTTFWRTLRRSLRRLALRQTLWNSNRETLCKLLTPSQSVLVDVWQKHADYNRRFEGYIREPRFAHIQFVVLRSQDEMDRWIALQASRNLATTSTGEIGSNV